MTQETTAYVPAARAVVQQALELTGRIAAGYATHGAPTPETALALQGLARARASLAQQAMEALCLLVHGSALFGATDDVAARHVQARNMARNWLVAADRVRVVIQTLTACLMLSGESGMGPDTAITIDLIDRAARIRDAAIRVQHLLHDQVEQATQAHARADAEAASLLKGRHCTLEPYAPGVWYLDGDPEWCVVASSCGEGWYAQHKMPHGSAGYMGRVVSWPAAVATAIEQRGVRATWTTVKAI